MAVWGGLTNSCEKRGEKQRRKGKILEFYCILETRWWLKVIFLLFN